MEKILQNIPKEKGKDDPNFHEIAESRREIKKILMESGDIGTKYYKKPLSDIEERASKFKIAELGGLSNAKEFLGKQKEEYEKNLLGQIDYESILKKYPEVGEIREIIGNVADLKNFRMRRMFEILDPKVSLSTKKISESVLEGVKQEIENNQEKLDKAGPLVLRQAEILKGKEDLGRSGHICITPSTEKI